MKVLFIITGSIAVSKCFEILDELKKNKVIINCIITNNAKMLFNTNKLKKIYLVKSILMQAKQKRKCFILIYQEKMIY